MNVYGKRELILLYLNPEDINQYQYVNDILAWLNQSMWQEVNAIISERL